MIISRLLYIIYLWYVCSFSLCTANGTNAPSAIRKHSSLERTSVLGCGYYLAKINTWDFDYSNNTGFYATICNYPPALQSWAICVYTSVSMNNKTFEKSFEEVKSKCTITRYNYTLTLSDYYDVLHNGTKYARAEPIHPHSKINFPIYVNDSVRNQFILAYYTYGRNLDVANLHSIYIYVYFFIILIIGTILNYCQYTSLDVVLFKYKFLRFIRGYIITPTLFKKHSEYFSYGKFIMGLLPTRSEALTIFGYFLLHIYLLSTSFQYDPKHCLFASMGLQKLRFFADRTGILAFANLPLIILLSIRNTICEILTGVKYSTLIMLHKWIGRIMFIDVFLHGSCYIIYAVRTKSFHSSIQMVYYQFGLLAFLGLLVLIFFSVGYFRRYYYETFLYGHILLAIWFFYSCWKHVERLGWKGWIYSSLLIWITERIFRLCRILSLGILDARLQLIGDNLLRITIIKPTNQYHIFRSCLDSKPGQYYFVYFLKSHIFWQSHPFSVMNFDKKMVLVIKPKEGITKYLYNLVKKSPSGDCKMKVAIEGPYGPTPRLHLSDDLLFLAGGTGLIGPISHILELSSNQTMCSKIYLFIIVRDTNILDAFKNELFKIHEMSVIIHIFITNAHSRIQREIISTSSSCATSNSPLLSSNKGITFLDKFCTIHYKKPNIREIIKETVNNSLSSLTIICCGPPGFVDLTRNFVSKAILSNENKSISYFEEFQCW